MKQLKRRIGASPDVRAQLLETAATLFAAQGVTGTTIADIARPVGVTSAMVHYYFKTKDQLLDAVVEELLIGKFIAFVGRAMSEKSESLPMQMQRLVWRIIEATEQMPWLPSLWVREVLSDGGTMRVKLLSRTDASILLRFKDEVEAEQRAGHLNPQINPKLLFVSIIAMTLLPLAMARSWDQVPAIGKINNEDLGNHVVALLMSGLSVSTLTPIPNE